ncbi:MAG TPA: LysR substrate-binding domain-containing protein, partial [Solirubrobacteraceae bacterium]
DLQPRQLRYFLAVAEELHFGRAAARLYISQPSLSNQIHKLEQTLGTELFVRTSREVKLTAAGQALLEEAPLALAALDRAAERTGLAGAGITGTVRLGFAPPASFETLGTILAFVENDNPNLTVIPSELFSAEIPGRVLGGDLDIGLALHPDPMTGILTQALRVEPVAALVGKRHRLAEAKSISLGDLEHETVLLFPRELAPAYYDRIMESCQRAGFQPQVKAFPKPSVHASLAHLLGAREVGLIPTSFAFHAAQAEPGVVARSIVDPPILAEWSILWPARAQSPAVTRFLDSARHCAAENEWLPVPSTPATANTNSLTARLPSAV